MTKLRNAVIRLANADEGLRPHLLPLLREAKRPTIPRSGYLPDAVRGTDPNVDPEGTDLDIWTWEEDGRPYGIAFQGRGRKPLWHYRFTSESSRDREIKDTIDARKEHMRAREERAKARREFEHGLNVGDILYSSWGYDQTNVDFYEVTELRGKMVVIREVASKTVKSTPPQDYVVPVPGRYIGKPMKKRPQVSGGRPYVKITSFAHAYPWDGKPKYQTSGGWGH